MKTVIVTGGTKRLGKVIADKLEASSWRVLRTSHRSDAQADIVVDLSTADGPELLIKEAIKLNGGVCPDALVNNAALFALDNTDVMTLNYKAPCKLVDLMSRFGNVPSIVNILDSRILYREATTCYEQSKKALLNFTLKGTKEYSGRVRINAVAPGPVMVPEFIHEPAGVTPLGRPTPSDVAEAVVYLLSAKATSGCVIPVDGAQACL